MPKLPKITSLLFLCNIWKKKVSHEVDFLHADKHKSLPQIDTMIFKVPKIASLQCLYNISKNKLEMKLLFCMQISIKVSYKLILSLLIGMIKHSQSTQNNRFVIYLQYLKKKLETEFMFCMQINIKVSTVWHYSFWWIWPNKIYKWKQDLQTRFYKCNKIV